MKENEKKIPKKKMLKNLKWKKSGAIKKMKEKTTKKLIKIKFKLKNVDLNTKRNNQTVKT